MRTFNTRFVFFLTYCILQLTNVFAQTNTDYQIKGSIDLKNNPVYGESLSVQLLKEDQKTIAKMEVVKSDGVLLLTHIANGNYFIQITGPNIEKYVSTKLVLNKDIDLGLINLTPKTTALKEVSVTSSKPLVEQFYDKTVVNVASSINAVGATALEVLTKSPGVTIDKDDNISMRGRQGVLIMIDGKLVPMSGQDLATMLRNMSANQIDKIDIITNPSAKYDASGNSGIIDIRLKKDTRLGTNGSLTGSYGQGQYGKFNAGLNLNNRTGKLNVFGSYNYGDRNPATHLQLDRTFYDASGSPLGGYDEDNHLKTASISHNIRLGADYYITPKTIIGFVANGLYFNNNSFINNNAFSRNNLGQDTSSFATTAHNTTKRDNNSINLNFKTSLDSLGSELTADADYASYDRTDLQNYITRYYNLQNIEDQTPYALFGNLVGKLNIKSLKVDYTKPLSKTAKLEFGLKSSWVTSDNDVRYYNQSNGGNLLDTTKSNHFVYDENINAAYANASEKWGKTSLQLGLRMENTNTKGVQLTDNTTFKNNYVQLFPSGYLGYQLNKDNDFGISLSRRINRPTYNQLNPFKLFLDPTTYVEGNPYLKPEITDSYELNWTFEQNYMIKVGYSATSDNILSVISPDALNSNVVVQTPRNIAHYNYYNVSFSIPVTIGKWLNSSNNAVVYFGKYNGEAANTVLNNSDVAYNINSDNTIIIDKNWSAEVAGNYQSRALYGFQDGRPYGSLDIGVQTKLFNNNANLKFNMTDILFTNFYRSSTALTGYKESFIQHNDTRMGTISFTYKFGNGKLPAARRKVSGVEDEKRRAQS